MATIKFNSLANLVLLAITIKSAVKTWLLVATAVSDIIVWLTWAIILLKSLANTVRLAIIARSELKVLGLLTTALSDAEV